MNGFVIVDGRRLEVIDGVLCEILCERCGGDAPPPRTFTLWTADGARPLCAACYISLSLGRG